MSAEYTVDSSVVIRWFVPQVGFEHAQEIYASHVAGDVALMTCDVARFELAHVLRTKGLVPGILDREEYLSAAMVIDDLGLAQPVARDDFARAVTLAADCGLRVFDALFVDLALQRGWPLLTADARLARATADLITCVVLRGITG